jgi:Mg-chelatase subunit ChlD
MAALLAVDLSNAAKAAGNDDFVLDCIGFKGIGGGDNLLKQWFSGGQELSGQLRDRIKQMAKAALLELGLAWASRAGGSLEEGMIPQNETRPLRASDDIDLLDIEGTIETLISEGRSPESLSEEDLFVHDTARGRASFGVLIDISGSMAGEELAICAIAVVMLLGRLQSEEIAIALFESDTHVVKGFNEDKPLDPIADELLDLQATGGTCVDAALTWIAEQFAERQESSVQLLFLLSDFCFFEDKKEITAHAEGLAELDVQLLAASHGLTDIDTRNAMLKSMPGDLLELTSVSELPERLNQAISQIADWCR